MKTKKLVMLIIASIAAITFAALARVNAYADEAAFVSASVTASSDFTLHVKATVPESVTSPTVHFTRGRAEATVSGTQDGDGWIFSYYGIFSQCLADVITMDLMDGETILATEDYSIREYFDDLHSATAAGLGLSVEQFAALKTLIADTLEYGAAAQSYIRYNTGDPANSLSWVETDKTQDFVLPSNYREVVVAGTAPDRIKGVKVILSNINRLSFAVEAQNADRLVITGDGATATIPISFSGVGYIDCAGLPATSYDTVWTVTLTDSSETVYSRVKYSLNSYIATKAPSAEGIFADILRTLYNYGASADEYIDSFAVATTGGVTYPSVALAVNAAANGGTVEILKNSTATGTITVNKELTILGGGHTLYQGSFGGALFLVSAGGDLTFGNGTTTLTLDGTSAAAGENSPALIHVVSGGNVEGSKITLNNPKYNALYVSNATADVSNLTINNSGSGYDGVYLSGSANVTLSNLTIGSASRHGININSGSTLTLNTASVSNITTYNGIYVNGGTLTGGNVTIDRPKYNGIEVLNNGSATINGYTATNAPRNGALVTNGTFDVTNATISTCSYHGIDVESAGTLAIDTANISSITLNGVFVNGGTVTGNDVTVNTATQGLAASGGNVTIDGYTISNTSSNGVKIYSNAIVAIDDLSVTTTTSNHGVYILGGARLTVNGGTVTGANLNPFFVEGGTLLGGEITVSSSGGHGLAVSGGTVDIDGYTITSTPSNRQGVNIYNSSTVEIDNLTIGGAGVHGINLETGSTLTLNTASISNIATYNGIYVNGGTLTGSNITIDRPKYNGMEVLNGGSATINGYTATNAPRNGALVTKGTFNVTNASISGNTYHGIDVASAGILIINNSTISGNTLNAINNAGSVSGGGLIMSSLPYYGIYSSAGTIDIDGIQITGATRHALNLSGSTSAEIENATINGTGWEGIGLYNTASLTLKDSSILNWHTLAVKEAGTGTYTAINVTTS
ncbi:MAG: right-handed parallel beta-helix repeat-containing protein [Lachnospiraceae bacterium]|nr:right-handed parallel beta-helix repeat-containing protein [Lachnospiraceae bacterium]